MRPRVVIVGAGFGGLAVARGLARADVDVTLIDRQNHHLFQPLLYQVATAGLSPAEIAWPVRHLFRGQRNTRVLMGEVDGRRSRRGGWSCSATGPSPTTTWCSRPARRMGTSATMTGRPTRRD